MNKCEYSYVPWFIFDDRIDYDPSNVIMVIITQATSKVIQRRDLCLKTHPKVWRSPGSNSQSLVYEASSLTTKPRRLQRIRLCFRCKSYMYIYFLYLKKKKLFFCWEWGGGGWWWWGHRCNINFSNGQSIGIVLYGMCSPSLYIKGEN